MPWKRIALATVVGGIANNLVNFLFHGFTLVDVYTRLDTVFTQEATNPLFFLLIALVFGLLLSVLIAKTRASWAPGAMGGLACGLLAGAVAGTTHFFQPLVIEGFPYYLAWCWFGIELIAFGVQGALTGLIVK